MIENQRFAFTKTVLQSCASLRPGSASMGLTRCSIGPVPPGYTPYISGNGWYAMPARNWLVRDELYDTQEYWRPVCRTDGAIRQWKLIWSDEFNDPPDGQACYTSNDVLRCIQRPYLKAGACQDAPTAWNTSATASWSAVQTAQFGGLRALDKCTWTVFDSMNTWDVWGNTSLPKEQRTNTYRPENIRIENGVLKMRTAHHPTPSEADGYCCGKRSNTGTGGEDYTMDCPYSGGKLITETSLLTKEDKTDNRRDHPDPTKRYVGRNVAFGRIEFRARITKLGHGAWPSLWMFTDRASEDGVQAGDIDVLEYMADSRAPHDHPLLEQSLSGQLRLQSSTYGMAGQTAHHYVGDKDKTTVAKGVAIPIGTGEWHVYAAEWEPNEIRFYTDSCRTERIVEGQQVIRRWSSPPVVGTFHVPTKQSMSIMIGNPASASRYMPEWYRALGKKTDLCGNGDWSELDRPKCADAEPFQPTEFEVDYVRVYYDTKLPPQHPEFPIPMQAPRVLPHARPPAMTPIDASQH